MAAVAGAAPSAAAEADDEAEAGSDGYLVCPGDDLWSIAEQQLGDGSRWRLIAEANAGLAANPTVDLVAGTRLVLPELPADKAAGGAREHGGGAVAQQAKPETAKPLTVVVERGDTLSGLAERHLGTRRSGRGSSRPIRSGSPTRT